MTEMEIETTDDDILKKLALDGSMDYSSWPTLLQVVVSRIEKIAHTEFPIPRIPQPQPPVRPPSPRFLAPLPSSDPIEPPSSSDTTPSSQETNKENAKPSPSRPAAPPAAAPSSSATTLPSSSAPTALASSQPEPLLPSTLPAPIAALLTEILHLLTNDFARYPPHTIQRLAELVLRPRQHYRSLVAYLHALDRVVHVTSGANIYPLPPAIPDLSAMSLLANGGAGGLSINSAAANNPGSDEALGGALLTPIPWLARRANGTGSEDGSDGGSSSPMSGSGGSGLGISEGGGGPSQPLQMHIQQQTPQPQPQLQAQSSPQQHQLQQQQQQRQQQQQPTPNSRKLEPQVRTESTETIEGPNGMGSIETVSISINGISSAGSVLAQRGVTQGELLRQEQRAGVVPLSQLARQQQQQQQAQQQAQQQQAQAQQSTTVADQDASMTEELDHDTEDEEVPHARGPEEIGAADTGPQSAEGRTYLPGASGTVDMRGIDVEAAVGRRLQSPPATTASEPKSVTSPEELVPRSPKREAADELVEAAGREKRLKEDGDGEGEGSVAVDAEGDVVIRDKPASVLVSEVAGGGEGGGEGGDEDAMHVDGGEGGGGPGDSAAAEK
ncbi:hypothetical protein B0T19DRAFT_406057 [Cercophora scortea]|uniref:Uncharacterized protein n=1 Tax=Cercophora scortea TaxID=314031 RepID=A0AAE0J315_9PEZI|nr:hypothetical protein B0T19DRAFT_406057 [Cercophora scortea]